jgi:hypothetical protein
MNPIELQPHARACNQKLLNTPDDLNSKKPESLSSNTSMWLYCNSQEKWCPTGFRVDDAPYKDAPYNYASHEYLYLVLSFYSSDGCIHVTIATISVKLGDNPNICNICIMMCWCVNPRTLGCRLDFGL